MGSKGQGGNSCLWLR